MPLEGHRAPRRNYRVVFLGSTGVGKTSIINQLLYENFPEQHKETLEELHRHVLIFDTMAVEIDILDTSGTHEFPAMRHLAITTGNAFLLVYSVKNQESFANIKFLINEIKEYKQDNDYFILVVANKSDLLKNENKGNALDESVVCFDWEEKFVTISAKTGDNIKNVLEILKENVEKKIIDENKKLPHLRRISMPAMISKHGHEKLPSMKRKARLYSAD
ncbi:ras-related protein Rap-2a-like [Mercenaria mercenaria]|uniref:ras-related protein Rap-2a-like n=1 Tax=Mercenaria mercenaria TaxID=6596 RepID=UPI001E1DBF75|nr:ras-related protein Rap-2a-like [Mercenaria mercenaria]